MQVTLKGQKCLALARTFAELNSARSQVSDDAAPERVVEINDGDFPAFSDDRADQPGRAVSVRDQAIGSAGHLKFEIKAGLKPTVCPGL